jgi:hypothetical protein
MERSFVPPDRAHLAAGLVLFAGFYALDRLLRGRPPTRVEQLGSDVIRAGHATKVCAIGFARLAVEEARLLDRSRP